MFVVIFGRPACPFCVRAKEHAETLKAKGVYNKNKLCITIFNSLIDTFCCWINNSQINDFVEGIINKQMEDNQYINANDIIRIVNLSV